MDEKEFLDEIEKAILKLLNEDEGDIKAIAMALDFLKVKKNLGI